MDNIGITEEEASFKDPDAKVFIENGIYVRKIFKRYIPEYRKLINSGLYNDLISKNLLIKHEETKIEDNCITIKPEQVFISYPWEWCFSQLKDAALTTLKIQQIALDYNMSLKDANCFNIQFLNNKPLLIDTSSYETDIEGQAWVAYKQFCENFIAPLALMAYSDLSLNKLFLMNINGIPLELTSKLLPFKTKFNLNLFTHIHLHSKMQNKYSENSQKMSNIKIDKQQLKNIIKNLQTTVENINLQKYKTEWENYYSFTNYTEKSFDEKYNIIDKYRSIISPKNVWDFGSNTGIFSRIFSKSNSNVTAFDIDPMAIEKNYLKIKKDNENNIFPLVFDLANPSPALGWANKERKNLLQRAQNIDLILALALIHHLRFTYNIPFENMAKYFCSISKYLIIEFVDKNDSKVQKMLLNRKDIFDDYTQENFENIFGNYYKILYKNKIPDTERTLYLMEKK